MPGRGGVYTRLRILDFSPLLWVGVGWLTHPAWDDSQRSVALNKLLPCQGYKSTPIPKLFSENAFFLF